MRTGTERRFDSLVAAVLFLAACAWTGCALYTRVHPPARSAVALYAAVTEELPLEGLLLRQEEAVCASPGADCLAEDGERLPRGGAVALLEGGETLRTEESALFFTQTDGFEYLEPSLLEGLGAEGLEALLRAEPRPQPDALGRLVTGREVWFAAPCARELAPGPCRLRFEDSGQTVRARLLRSEGGVLVLRLTEEGDAFRLRRARARLILRELSGLELPEAAVRRGEDGESSVELLTLHGPELRRVNLVYSDGERCLLRPLDGEETLPAGSTVLIPAQQPQGG